MTTEGNDDLTMEVDEAPRGPTGGTLTMSNDQEVTPKLDIMPEMVTISTGRRKPRECPVESWADEVEIQSEDDRVNKDIRRAQQLLEDQACNILNECCEGGADRWDKEGTLTIPGMFSWLETGVTVDGHYERGVKHLIDHEWSMYLHHQRLINNESNLGWLRNMLYGVTQQVMHQDLGHWLAYVAEHPDHNPTLVSSPYYAKYVFEKDAGSAFRHIDLNIDQFLATGRGANAIQGSVSLDNESAEAGCTELVKGFHRHIETW